MDIIGFIGSGNMGYAMMTGMIKSGMKERIVFTDKNLDRRLFVVKELEIRPYNTNQEIAEASKYIVLAVKPQFIKEAIDDIKEFVTDQHIIISIAPVAISSLKDLFGKQVRVVRVMPNTPALVGEGMSAISFSDNVFTDEEKNTVTSIFSSFGEFEVMEEKYMSAVTAVSGSSPAYVYMFIEAMADAAVKYGMPRKTAYKFAAQAVLGSAKMVLQTGEHPGVLKDNVCSPGGTTIEAVSVLEKQGFRSAVIEAMDACYNKTNLLSNKK
jgi:pyrroline-5-carboxylate reductase